MQCKKFGTLVYKKLLKMKGQIPQKSQEKWLLKFTVSAGEIDWSHCHILTSLSMFKKHEAKRVSFQIFT